MNHDHLPAVRLGVIGACGHMAKSHQSYFPDIPGLTFTAASDVVPEALGALADEQGVEPFADASAMIRSGRIDAVLIACPHFDHPRFAIEAFEAGVHVLCEKPIAVTAAEAERVNAAYDVASSNHPGLLFAGMFNQRTNPVWKEVKRLCSDGSLGELARVSWTITDWFRSQAYYNSGGWRATWAGEGGGVLINQCPHNLDLLQWFVGMPSRVRANAALGRYHDIEVEDDVTAILEFENGATGTFITSTGQSPGINRLEIVGDGGTIVVDRRASDTITFWRADEPVSEFCRTTPERFANVPSTTVTFAPAGLGCSEHEVITRNFVETIRQRGTQDALIAPGTEMIHGLELGNAMLMSGLQGLPIGLPTDRAAFEAALGELQAGSRFQRS